MFQTAYNSKLKFQGRKNHHNLMMVGLDSHLVMMVMVAVEAVEVVAIGQVDSSSLVFLPF